MNRSITAWCPLLVAVILAPLSGASAVSAPAAPAAQALPADTISLFDGQSLKGWAVTDFGGHGEVKVAKGQIEVSLGAALSGVTWTNAAVLATNNFEISLEAMKVEGSDFFCGLTFPVKNSHATLVMGGWGGSVTGISSIDSQDASENETTKFFFYDKNRWYKIRVRVAADKIEVWLDGERVINADIAERKVSLRPGDIDLSCPLGLSTYQTSGAFRNITFKRLGTPAK